MTEPKQFGLTKSQWESLYNDAGWRAEVASTCKEVASCDHANPSDREAAVGILGSLIEFGLAPGLSSNGRSFPEFVRDVQISIVKGRPQQLDKELRDLMHERLGGVVWVLSTVQKFIDVPALAAMAQKPAEIEGAN